MERNASTLYVVYGMPQCVFEKIELDSQGVFMSCILCYALLAFTGTKTFTYILCLSNCVHMDCPVTLKPGICFVCMDFAICSERNRVSGFGLCFYICDVCIEWIFYLSWILCLVMNGISRFGLYRMISGFCLYGMPSTLYRMPLG